jgi:hypothetical protein
MGDENIKKQINLEINVGMKDSVVSDRGMYQTTNKLSAQQLSNKINTKRSTSESLVR